MAIVLQVTRPGEARTSDRHQHEHQAASAIDSADAGASAERRRLWDSGRATLDGFSENRVCDRRRDCSLRDAAPRTVDLGGS